MTAFETVKSRLAIVLIPGSHSTLKIYEPISKGLEARGFDNVAGVQLLSACPPDRQRWPPATLDDDAQHIRKELEGLIRRGRDIIVVMCSFGGFPGTEALKNLPSRNCMAKENEAGGAIVGLLYLSSFIPWEGESLQSLAEQPKLELGTYGDLGNITGPDIFSEWAQDPTRVQDIDYQFRHLGTQSADSMQGRVSHNLWPEGVFHGKIMFVVGENDLSVNHSLRKKMIERVDMVRRDKIIVQVVAGAGHLMILERSQTMVEAIEQFIGVLST